MFRRQEFEFFYSLENNALPKLIIPVNGNFDLLVRVAPELVELVSEAADDPGAILVVQRWNFSGQKLRS